MHHTLQTTEDINLYRNILWNTYKDVNDEDIILLVRRIKGFCHTVINSHLKDISEKKTNKFLSFHSEKNDNHIW